jgi:hypothetical protein
MAKYAVAYINFMDNKLDIEFIEADGWKNALSKSQFCKGFTAEDYAYMPQTLEEVKQFAFDQDAMIDVKEIT